MMQEDSNGDFEIVDKKMAGLMTSGHCAMMTENSTGDFVVVDNKKPWLMTSDPSKGSNSVLANVAPPAALPSFLASPLPVSSPSVPPTSGVPFKPEGHMAQPIPPSGIPHPSNIVPTSTVPPPAGIPPSGPPPSGPPPSGPPPSLLSSGIPSSTPVPSPSPNAASPQPPIPTSSPPLTLTPSPLAHSPIPAAPFVPSSGPPLPVSSQPQVASADGNVDASVDLGSPGVGVGPSKPGWFGWIRGTVSNVGHKVAEKARSSMDTMITTLDPQMKEFIHSGGDMDVVVASDKEVKIGAVREAFQFVFGKATIVGMAAQSESVAAQPVGFAAALQSGEERINSLRSSGRVHPQQPVVSVENFIAELTPDCWYDIGLLLLDDPGEDIILQTYTQGTPVPPDYVSQAKAATQDNYPFKGSGFATTVGQIASQSLQVHHSLWQESLTGVPRRDLIVLAARTLAGLYKCRLPQLH